MNEWDEWKDVRFLVKERLEEQNNIMREMRDDLRWMVKLVVGAIIAGLINLLLNAKSLL